MPWSTSRRRNAGMGSVLSLTLVLWLVACTPPPPSIAPLRPLHLPHVTRITALDQALGSSTSRRLEGMATYVPPSAPAQSSAGGAPASTPAPSDLHLLGTTIVGTLYDVDVDRGTVFTVAVADACDAYLSVTADGRWAACGTEAGTETFTLGAPQPAHQGLLLENVGVQARYESVSWGPDSYSLAAVVFHADDSRSVNFYSVTYGPQLIATLTFPDLVVDQASWSPDGQWLAVEASLPNGIGGFTARLLHVGPLLPGLTLPEDTSGRPPSTIVVTASMLEDLQGGDVAWGPHEGEVTYLGGNGIVVRTLATGGEHTLLTQDSGNLCGLSWAPDGSRLVFQICGAAPANLYVYDAAGTS